MENTEKKSFFELMDSRSAMIVGGVAGLLVLCTIGFIVLVVMSLTRGLNCSAAANGGNKAVATAQSQTQDTAAAQQQGTPPSKTDKPKVELFVMSYCPYGLQMEKAYLPVISLLSKKAEMDIKFVSYSMHGKKEIDENTRQYCIQKDQNAKYVKYLTCFTGKDDYAACLKEASVNESQVTTCMAKADKEFSITAKFDDKASWLSGLYPMYQVNAVDAEKYGVQGSPTLVINGTQVEVARSPEAVKEAVCASFTKAPSECDTKLSTQSAASSFGTGAGANTDASCG
jgi:protein-disulfide isomerase